MVTSLVRLFGSLGILAGTLLAGSSALAQSEPVRSPRAVVELFTSQGCSSCPPADANLAELARRPGVIALTLPVDYWDYLGWKDTLAHASFSARQRGYAHARGDRQVFTPQAVINGRISVIGSDRAQIDEALRESALPLRVSLAENGAQASIVIEGEPTRDTADLYVLPVVKARTVEIGRGENRGRTITYANVVLAITRIGEFTGGSFRVDVPLMVARGSGDGFVVLVQGRRGVKPGAILGAAISDGM
jgi:hypothetical protein